MSKFFVGQRVRMARAVKVSRNGKEGRIAEFYPQELPANGGVVNCAVDWDDGDSDLRYCGIEGNTNLATHTDQLEPILPSGHRASDFANVIDLLDSLKRTQRNPDEVAA